MKRVHLIIGGIVQGVGFRAWTRRTALKLKLTGCVKNREDDTVEIVAEGPGEAIKKFVKRINAGPPSSWVQYVKADWQDYIKEFDNFSIFRR